MTKQIDDDKIDKKYTRLRQIGQKIEEESELDCLDKKMSTI